MFGKLKGEVFSAFLEKIKVLGYLRQSKDENQMWKTMADNIRQMAKEILGASTGKPKVYKELWLWNEEVQEKINEKNKRFKELMDTEKGTHINRLYNYSSISLILYILIIQKSENFIT